MTITGAHVLLYSPQAEAVRSVLGSVLGSAPVDAGGGWLIYALPTAEIGVHPSDGSTHHELSLTCDDATAAMAELAERGVEFRGEPEDKGFGIAVTMVLPGGVDVLLYEPRHPTAV